jgi:hypothetical protein
VKQDVFLENCAKTYCAEYFSGLVIMKKSLTTVLFSREIEQKGRDIGQKGRTIEQKWRHIGQKGRSLMLFTPITEKKTAPAELFSPLVLLGA